MNSILIYGLGLLVYTSLVTLEENRFTFHLNQLLKRTKLLHCGKHPQRNGSHSASRAAC